MQQKGKRYKALAPEDFKYRVDASKTFLSKKKAKLDFDRDRTPGIPEMSRIPITIKLKKDQTTIEKHRFLTLDICWGC